MPSKLPLAVAAAFALAVSPAAPAAAQASAGLSTGSHDVVVNGVRLWYRVAGRGAAGAAPVVYLHGGPGYNSYSFAALAGPGLERGLRMVYLDQRGCGRSERPWTGQYAMDTLVADLEGLRRALGVPQIALIGHSFGGALALEYAARYPEHVARLVFVDGFSDAPLSGRGLRARVAEAFPAGYARVLADSAHLPATDLELALRVIPDTAIARYLGALQFHDAAKRVRQDSVDAASGLRNTGEQQAALVKAGLWRYRFDRTARLTMPVLVIAGRYDGVIGLEAPQALARALPQGRFVEYEGSGHFPFVEEPARFARDVVAFLNTAR